MSEENPSITEEFKNIEVILTNVATLERQNLVVLEPNEPTVNVKVSGKRNDLNKITRKDIVARVDLSGYQEGSRKVPVYIEVPEEIKVVDYSPREILFKFDKLVRKEMPITVETVGELAKDHTLLEPVIKPQSIYVEGPKTWVDSVAKVVAFVDVTDKASDINVTVPIKIVDNEGNDVRGVSKDQNSVDVFIPVNQLKTVPIKIQTAGQLPDNYEILDIGAEPSSIQIQGRKELIKDIDSIKTKVIDISTLVENNTVSVELELPEGISLLDPNQKVIVRLNVDENKTRSFDYILKDIKILNLDPELQIDPKDLEKSFSIKIEGTASKVDALKKKDLDVELDLQDLDEGSHIVSIIARAKDVEIVAIRPETLEIRLIAE
ncbi:MAG TPA: hypothetical protein GXX70_08390 [Tepidimicrobium sp.]|nr:hypothetical protein [Tepidimicrobium sp.]